MKSNKWPVGVPMATPIPEGRIYKMLGDHSAMDPSPERNLIRAVIGQAIMDEASIKTGSGARLLREIEPWYELIGIEPDFIRQIYEVMQDQPRLCSALSSNRCDCPACANKSKKNPLKLCYRSASAGRCK